jgi:class 3 adenylate cyclase
MGENEEGTHERLKAHLRELVEPKIREHRGCTVKNTGDSFLAEFPSIVDAVRCPWRSSAEWPTESPRCPRSAGSGSASASTSVM